MTGAEDECGGFAGCVVPGDCPTPTAACAEARCLPGGACAAARAGGLCSADQVCDPSAGCVTPAPIPEDAEPRPDASIDAGRVDGGLADGGQDASPMDAGVDAGSDAGPADSGVDSGPADAGTRTITLRGIGNGEVSMSCDGAESVSTAATLMVECAGVLSICCADSAACLGGPYDATLTSSDGRCDDFSTGTPARCSFTPAEDVTILCDVDVGL